MVKERDSKEKKAIALQYDKGEAPAPKVVAKGEGFLAEQLIEIAEQHGIEIHEDASLVEVLSALEVDDFIPYEAYAAVAEILSYLYNKDASVRSDKKGS